MKLSKNTFILPLLILLSLLTVYGQNASTGDKKILQSVIGKVQKIDQPAGKIEIETDDKKNINISILQKATFLQIKSTEKNLENAAKISISQIKQASKILARGTFSGSGDFSAQMIVVISDMETEGNSDAQNTTVAGTVTDIDPATKQIKTVITSPTGSQILTLNAQSLQVNFYRYAANSLKFNNSIPTTFDKIRVGDQFKSVGKLIEGTEIFTPKTIAFGTFRTIGGKIISIDNKNNQVTLEDFQSKKPINISISDETVVKFLNDENEKTLINSYFKNNEQANQRKDLRAFFDTLPIISSEKLLVGDNIIFSAVVTDESNITAFYVLKDVKSFFLYLEKLKKNGKPLPNLGGISL